MRKTRAVLAGLLLALSTPPLDWWFCAVLGLGLLYTCIHRLPWRRRALLGFLAGFAMFAISLAWTRQFSTPGWIVLTIGQALFLGLGCALAVRGRGVVFAAGLVLAELLRVRIPFGGFPMGSFTTSQANGPFLPAASIVGEHGLVFLLALAGIFLVRLFRFHFSFIFLAILLIVPAWGASIDASGSSGTSSGSSHLRVATVQAGGPQATPDDLQRPDIVFADHLRTTAEVRDPVDVLVWPENVMQVNGRIDGTTADATIAQLARSHQTTVIAGVVEILDDHRFGNASVVWGPDGRIIGRYDKVHRVPFGEYVPMRGFFDRLADLSPIPRDAVAGNGPAVVDIPVLDGRTVKAGIAVSYEGLFPQRTRAAVREGGEVLLIPTNAASYRSKRVPETQVQAARLRAVESRRWVVQAAPTGISAIIDDRGHVRQRTAMGKPAVLHDTVELSDSRTPYDRWGDWLVALVSVLLLIHAFRKARRTSRRDRTQLC